MLCEKVQEAEQLGNEKSTVLGFFNLPKTSLCLFFLLSAGPVLEQLAKVV